MGVRHILFVEDDAKIIDLMEMAVEAWNAAHVEQDRQFSIETCKTADEAKAVLGRTRFDAALFDLRLPGETKGRSTEPLGNELALYALQQLGIPVAIMSGNPNDVDDRLRQFAIVSVFFKGDKDAYSNAVEWFGGWWDMMAVVAGSRQKIQASSAEIFVKRLWPQWKEFAGIQLAAEGHTSLMDIVTRQYVSHVAELLGLDGPDHVKWHPFESYVIPSLWSHRAHTGDIFDFDGDLRIVLTPQCDMANGNVANVLLARCSRGEQEWTQRVQNLKDADTDPKKDKAGKYFRKMINQQLGASQHFLPPLPGEAEPVMVDFSDVTVLPLDQVMNELPKRIASVSAPFLTNLTQRFGAYVSRVGQPNIDVMYFLPVANGA
jgi:CheY-like chemotaxis protein